MTQGEKGGLHGLLEYSPRRKSCLKQRSFTVVLYNFAPLSSLLTDHFFFFPIVQLYLTIETKHELIKFVFPQGQKGHCYWWWQVSPCVDIIHCKSHPPSFPYTIEVSGWK